VQHGMFHHFEQFCEGEIGEKGPRETKEVFDKFRAHRPWTEGMPRIKFYIGEHQKKAITEAVEHVETGRGCEGMCLTSREMFGIVS